MHVGVRFDQIIPRFESVAVECLTFTLRGWLSGNVQNSFPTSIHFEVIFYAKCKGTFPSLLLWHFFFSLCTVFFFPIVLSDLGDELHRAREVWDISKMCPCKGFVGSEDNESAAKITELCNDVMDATGENQNQNQNQDKVNDNKAETQEANDAAAASSSANLGVLDSESSFDGSDDVNLICHESLGVESPANHEQEWLTEEKRRNHFTKKAGFGLVDAKPHRDKGVSHGLSLLMDYNSSTEGSPCESPAKSDMKSRASTFNFSVYRGLDLLVLACESKEGFPISCSQSLDQGNWKEEETTRSERQDKPSDKNITDGI